MLNWTGVFVVIGLMVLTMIFDVVAMVSKNQRIEKSFSLAGNVVGMFTMLLSWSFIFGPMYDFLTGEMQSAFANESVAKAIAMIMACALSMINFLVIGLGVTVLKKLIDMRSTPSLLDSRAAPKEG